MGAEHEVGGNEQYMFRHFDSYPPEFRQFGVLAIAMRTLPASTAYAVWTGLGAAGVAIMGVAHFGERLNHVQIAFILLAIMGVVGTKLFATA